MSNKKLLAIFLLNAPSYACIFLFHTPKVAKDEVAALFFFACLIPGSLCWLAALFLSFMESVWYAQRARAGSRETIARPLLAWLLTLPMVWIIMNFAAMQ